ncbi:beta strand repeat-containing protein [Pseudorhodoferax sp.]|uniref:beta strand repeat-containing protein n=1 Tax=Pseudorhodoferax sp. TaxID=1993553 RepID=UPI002DD6704A|nr:hypothetical protein [Pseudorhodoferax sp.]
MKRHALRPTAHAARTALLATLVATAGTAAHGAATTDGSTGAVTTLSGHFTVPQTLGTVRGANLFHSFGRFHVLSGESATFTTTDAGIRNVISRVTGTEASQINGTVRLLGGLVEVTTPGYYEPNPGYPYSPSYPGNGNYVPPTTTFETTSRPNFWFINPNGITIGAGGSFDVPASLHLSTAPVLHFADGATWDARGGSSSLTVAAPERFGFLDAPAAALTWQGSGSSTTLQAGSTFELAGGSIELNRAVVQTPQGRIRVQAQGDVVLSEGARLEVLAAAGETTPALSVTADNLLIDGRSGSSSTGLAVLQDSAATSGSGGLTLHIEGVLGLLGAAEITSSNLSAQTPGALTVRAGTLYADGEGRVASLSSWAHGSGPGALVDVQLGDALLLFDGGQMATFAAGTGHAGALQVQAADVLIDDGHQGLSTGLRSQTARGSGVGAAGAITLASSGALALLNGGTVFSNSSSDTTSGPVQVSAASARVDGEGFSGTSIGSLGQGLGTAAAVSVHVAGPLTLGPGGQISSGTLGPAAAGALQVSATTIELTGSTQGGPVTGVLSSGLDALAGRAGDVTVQADALTVRDTARISSATISNVAPAGNIGVETRTLLIDGGGWATGIESFGYGFADGGVGRVQVRASESLTLRDGGAIVAGARGGGPAGEISVNAGHLLINGAGASQSYTGIGGDSLGIGRGAAVTVNATQIDVQQGAQISSGTYSDADAGSVTVNADIVRVDGGGDAGLASGISTDSGGAGKAGNITVRAREMTVSGEGMVSSSALGSGAGGEIRIDADTLTITRSGGIYTVAGDSGNAGRIDLAVGGALSITDGGLIVANTGGSGAAGHITVDAGSLTMGGTDPAYAGSGGGRSRISSRALEGSGGQPGNVIIRVAGTANLQPGSLLSIANDAWLANPGSVVPPLLQLCAGELVLRGTEITAAASQNLAAGHVDLCVCGALDAQDSRISTTAVDGDGGPITIEAKDRLVLRGSAITTSVEGTNNGNGGDITIDTPALVLSSGFIQANTRAALARGGRVLINADRLIPDGNNVFIGGSGILAFRPGVPGYNVIQAAAPDGLSGVVDVTTPQLDLSANLLSLSTRLVDLAAVGRDICEVGPESRFTQQGRGALRTPATAPLRIEP